MISFDLITNYSTCIDENEFFKQFYNEKAHFRYDSNFFLLKYQPILEEFKLIENMQLAFSKEVGLEHIKFYWPENQGFLPEIVDYFQEQGYELEMLELYQINPFDFQESKENSAVQISNVTPQTLEAFKKISYVADLDFGWYFAQSKKSFYDWQFNEPSIQLVIAAIDGKAVGTLTMIVSEDAIEIDDVLTVKEYRNKGVATELQKFVMQEAKKENKTVILVADAEDTPKNMYKKQGYSYVSYQLGAQKVLDSRSV